MWSTILFIQVQKRLADNVLKAGVTAYGNLLVFKGRKIFQVLKDRTHRRHYNPPSFSEDGYVPPKAPL